VLPRAAPLDFVRVNTQRSLTNRHRGDPFQEAGAAHPVRRVGAEKCTEGVDRRAVAQQVVVDQAGGEQQARALEQDVAQRALEAGEREKVLLLKLKFGTPR
jgi:hypothetical protein